MDKNAIKKYAVWARRELIERVSQRAMIYGISAKDAGDPNAESINGHLLSQAEKRQRQALIRIIKTKGYEQVMEEVAYMWFNRFAALRFMEVNGYLPSHIRVFTNDAGDFKPQILAEAIHLELDGLDMNRVYELESTNKSEELFKYLLIVQCNALNSILPGMFQRIEDYTELLLPDYLLREGSVIEQMVTTIPEEDWTDQVQIIGWLYQYYNTEPKDKVFTDLKKNIKITKENVPAATQLFTPDWIVHYMVENSLGRLWLEGHPDDALKSEWKYYLDEAGQEPEVQAQLATIREKYAALKPEEIRVIDPCMGSGHILCVLFDVLVRIYEDYGYTAREAAVKIVENNLWGLDIDERAAQLSYFAVMMKARQYDRRFFTRKVQPHVHAILETNSLRNDYAHAKKDLNLAKEHLETLDYLMDIFVDAKEYGSILQLEKRDYYGLKDAWIASNSSLNYENNLSLWHAVVSPVIPKLIDQAIALASRYQTVATNPPYMGGNGMSGKLSAYVKAFYPDSKYDLFAVFIEKCNELTAINGFQTMITQHSWMFLSGYEKLRRKVLNHDIVSMAHLGARAFDEIAGEVVQTTAFTVRKSHTEGFRGSYRRLVTLSGESEKERGYFNSDYQYVAQQSAFDQLPASPIAYWVSEALIADFEKGTRLKVYGDTRQGMATSDNNRFLRFWYEIAQDKLGRGCHDAKEALSAAKKWYPYNKGGSYRKWYGNIEYVINYENDGQEVKAYAASLYKSATRTIKSISEYFKPCLSWSKVSTGNIAFRYYPAGFVFDVAGCCIFYKDKEKMFYDFGFINSKVAMSILSIIAPTMNFEAGHVASLPIITSIRDVNEVTALCHENVAISKQEWDSFETSWDFERHPFITGEKKIKDAYTAWAKICEKRVRKVQANERAINERFIRIYGLQNEISPDVQEDEITLRKAEIGRDIRSFISYAVGCMFGRYSLDIPGLVYAGGQWDSSKYSLFQPDKDAIIPICDDEYFEDDIVGRFVKFVEVVYGKDTLEENLRFIADALGGGGSSRKVIRSYFTNSFYADHLKIYQKRPIYWLFSSGKKNGFKCLIYMHRYQPDTIARIRTDYVHEQQSRYRTAIADLKQRINGASTSERVKLSKQLISLQAQAEEIRVYEEKVHHLADQMICIDLDDGVKTNYAIFKDILSKI